MAEALRSFLDGCFIVAGAGSFAVVLVIAVVHNWFGKIVKGDDDDPDPGIGGWN